MHENYFYHEPHIWLSPHFLDYLMDPQYAGINLNVSDETEHLLFAKKNIPSSTVERES